MTSEPKDFNGERGCQRGDEGPMIRQLNLGGGKARETRPAESQGTGRQVPRGARRAPDEDADPQCQALSRARTSWARATSGP